MIGCILSIFGWYYILRAAYGLYRIIEEIYLLKELDLSARYGKGSWAFITGSTDGIGLGYAKGLAKRGFNIILTGRNQEKLTQRATEIKELYKSVQVKTIQVDFANSYQPGVLEKLFEEVKDLDVSILVNNVGIYAHSRDTTTLTQPLSHLTTMPLVNCLPQAVLTKLFSSRFMKRSQRSALIHLSSVAVLHPLPQETYSASKTFNWFYGRAFSLNLKNYYKRENLGECKIDSLTVKPSIVTSNMTNQATEGSRTVPAETHVNGTLKVLGQKEETFGCTKHIIVAAILESLMKFVPYKYARTIFQQADKVLLPLGIFVDPSKKNK